ncbi:hypothetical protein BJY16_008099 [Actinoplanes octamycinicus]|uniref:DUF1963 domain-containing protein n=1 Tax=Actinoplanes octamycinicus TaxID=135948 RepID=A0A7W7H5Y8_9ACTN|nr:DUF1963 domain-containing protein [Actinoplanes octamycinicus]MBB4744640.1 hypothetical protein [Actinoplanes octamycinicus]GIE55221.1 hypothetical protein Aoc01nite_06230 [Actinoplanes octamycinicus]
MNLPPEVRALTRTRLDANSADWYLGQARPSIGYEVADEGWSAVGGDPAVAAFEWPAYQGEPMLMLAQIDCEEAADLLGADWPFPDSGRLLFFHDDDFRAPWGGPDGDDGCRVLHVADTPVAPLPAGRRTIEVLPLDPVPQATLPSWEDGINLTAHVADLSALLDLREELRPLLPTPSHRLLGHHDKLATPVDGHRPLLQIEAVEGTAWGEVVAITFWITDPDLASGNLANVRRSYEVA